MLPSPRAVRSDPAAVSSHLALTVTYCAFQPLRLCRPADDLLNEAESLHLRYGPASLCLRLAHVVTSMSPRLDSRCGGSFPGTGIAPAGSARLFLAHRSAGRCLASSGEITAPCPVPLSLTFTIPSSRTPALSHFRIRRTMRRSPTRCSTKANEPFLVHRVEERADVGVQYEVHLPGFRFRPRAHPSHHAGAPGPETVREPRKSSS